MGEEKKPIYKKWWFWIIVAIVIVGAIGNIIDDKQESEADKKLEEAKKKTEELEELSDQLNETSDLIEDTKKKMKESKGTTNEDNNNDESDTEESNNVDNDSESEPADDTSEIELEIESVVNADLNDTSITNIRVNEDMSADEERYIVLVDLSWSVKNTPGTTKDMLDMYSDHLAAKLTDHKSIYELVLFWTVPYHKEDDSILKRTYENKEKGMYLTDEVKDINIFD